MRILFVDDHEPFVKAVVTAFLQSDQIVHASTIAAARRELGAHKFDAILVDFDLPDAKGDLLVAEIRSKSPDQIIVAISAHEDGNAALLRAGADHACPKTQFSRIRAVLYEPRPMPGDLKAADPTVLSFTAAGNPNNEDRLLIARPSWGLVVAVADGAGGSGAGAFAADTAIEQIDRTLANSHSPLTLTQLAGLLERIDSVLVETRTGGETTCVVAQLVKGSVSGASVGDSSAVHIQPSGSTDLTAGQSRKPLLGSGGSTPVAFGPAKMKGLLLVATDGLIRYAPRPVFTRAMASPGLEGARDILLQSVRLRSGEFQDDTTGILVRL
jgi:CheY-like chemotaxis protein